MCTAQCSARVPSGSASLGSKRSAASSPRADVTSPLLSAFASGPAFAAQLAVMSAAEARAIEALRSMPLDRVRPGAVYERFGRHADFVENREQQVCHRRLRREHEVAVAFERAAGAADEC